MTSSSRFFDVSVVRRLTAVCAVFVLACAPSSGLASEYRWQGNGSLTGDFAQALWTRGQPGDADYAPANAGPPGADDDAFTQGASLTASGGSVRTLHVEGGTFTVTGDFHAGTAVATGVLTGSGTLTVRTLGTTGGTTAIQGGHVEAAVVQGGVAATQGGTLRVVAQGAGARLDLAAADTVAVDASSQVLVGEGEFRAGGVVQVVAGGQLAGVGTVAGHVIIGPSGLFAPGGDTGTLTVQGDLNLNSGTTTTAASQLNLVLGGNDHVLLVVTGEATLGGTLYVAYVNGYQPNAGDNLVFLRAGSQAEKFQLVTSFGTPAKARATKDAPGAFLRILSVTPGLSVQTSPITAAGVVGQPFTYRIAATNDVNGFSAGGLPPGLSFDAETGAISGTPTQAGDFPVYLILSNNRSTGAGYFDLTVADAPVTTDGGGTTVTALATVAYAYELEQSRGVVTVTRTGATTTDLVVGYTVKGTAVAGVDYKALKGSVTIPAGNTTAKVRVKALDAGITGYGVKTVKIVLQPGAGYELGAASSAKVKIYDDDLPPS